MVLAAAVTGSSVAFADVLSCGAPVIDFLFYEKSCIFVRQLPLLKKTMGLNVVRVFGLYHHFGNADYRYCDVLIHHLQ